MSRSVVRVLPDVPAIDREFDYSVDDELVDRVRPGTIVRIPLHGRRVRGWVLDTDVDPEPGVALSPVAKVTGLGPDLDVIDLCRWTAWRWAGRLATTLRLASPDRAVATVPRTPPRRAAELPDGILGADLLEQPGAHVVEVAPTTDPTALAVAAASTGQAIVVTPSVAMADELVRHLRSAGQPVARWPRDWAQAAAGATVVGGRAAVFAPAPELSAVVVLDEHDEALQSESSPTWHAREVAVERARRAGVPCLLVSPCPSLEALSLQDGSSEALWAPPGPLAPARPVMEELPVPRVRLDSAARRSGWAPVTVVDRRGEDSGRTGLYSTRLVDMLRSTARDGGRVVCVLNRTGRARLLACRSCGTVSECEVCGAAVHQDDTRRLVCGQCGTVRPGVCLECGSTALASLRQGVTRAREELEALAREPVGSVTASDSSDGSARIVVGTEAVLHRSGPAQLVAFLDLDQELLAPRYRAAEEAVGLLVLANRLLGGRSRGGRLLLQTRNPEHEVVTAALRADPRRVSEVEAARRRLLRFPPAATMAVVGGEAAPAFVERLGTPLGVQVQGDDDGRWVLRSEDRATLLDLLGSVARPPGRLRLWVDPARLR